MLYLFRIFFFLLFISTCSHANVITLKPTMKGIEAFSNMSIYEDSSKKMTIKDIQKQNFHLTDGIRSNKGSNSSNWWLKLEVENPEKKPIMWFLKFTYGQIDEMKAWQFDEENTLIASSFKGDHYIDKSKVKFSKRTAFMFKTLANEKNTIYIKLAYSEAGIIEMYNHIWSEKEFEQSQELRFNLLVGIISSLCVLLFYNLFILFILRKKEYFWYCTYVVGVICSTLTFNQAGAHFLWNNSLYFIDMMPIISGVILISSFVLFTRTFLETNKYLPKIDMILKALILVNVLILILANVGARHLSTLLIFAIIFSFVFFPIIGIMLWKRGHKIVRGYILSTFVLSIFIIISVFRFVNIIESSEFLFWAARFGFIIEGILFSIALADRIRLLQDDTKLAQEEVRKTLEDAKHNLELEVKKRTKELEIQTKKANELARIDPMTDIANRRAFFEKGEKFIYESIRYEKPFSLIILDIDHFKKVNDKYGHEAGDRVIISLTKEISKNIRITDFFARIGGEEFIILLSHSTSLLALEKAEKLLEKIRNLEIVYEDFVLKVTVSMGICEFSHEENIYLLLSKADKALYYVKENGRNGVSLHVKTNT